MKEIEYIQVGDYLLPNLKVEEIHLNRFGRAKLDDLYDRLVEEYKIKWNVTEELKQNDQIKWVQMMNNIKSCVDEIVYKKLLD